MGEILNLSFEEQEELAEEYDQKKIDYENSLAVALMSFFNRISFDFGNIYASTGEILDVEEYQKDLEIILFNSYTETSEFFSRHFDINLRRQLQSSNTEEEIQRTALLLALLNAVRPLTEKNIAEFIAQEVPKQAGYIIETTENVLSKSLEKAIEQIEALDDLEVTDNAVGKVAGQLSREENLNRVGTIKETEVANSSGSSMQIESNDFQKAINDSDDLFLKIIKQWITRLDSSVRPAHIEAHGQARDSGELYNVGSEKLLYPTDTSHGASLGNTINCRCQSINT